MYYFKVVSIVLGALWLGVGIVTLLYQKKIAQLLEKLMNKLYPEKRPAWMVIVAVIWIAFVVLTWVMQFVAGSPLAWIITILLTLTLFKVVQILLNYTGFREFAYKLIGNPNLIVILYSAAGVFGLALLLLGILAF